MMLTTFVKSNLRRGARQWAVLLQQQQLLLPSHHNSHSQANDVPLTHPSVCIWGANTNVGKTLVSAGLVAAAVRNQVSACVLLLLLLLQPDKAAYYAKLIHFEQVV
jgi:hypothetical protein